jgi:hypothetical protein
MIRGSRYKTDVPINQEQLNKLVNYHIRTKLDANAKRLYSSADPIEKDLMRESIKNLYIKSLVPLSATDVITKSLKETKNKAEIMQSVRKAIEAKQMGQMQQLSPTALTALSGATTVAEQEQAGLRAPRSDLGSTRAPYKTKKKMEKEQKQLMKGLTPEERRILQQEQTQAQTRGQRLTSILQRRGPQRLEDIREELGMMEDEPMAKTSAPKKGKGFRKPPKRQVKVSPEEKKKNRLQLVIAQIKAGNTNPKLILEVNKLYKSLYDIDNAFMMLK